MWEKFTARKRVREMREIFQSILGDYVHFTMQHPPKIPRSLLATQQNQKLKGGLEL